VGGLLNATFGNAPELIISLVALEAGNYELVRASIVGAILANLLLALGVSFFLGGLRHHTQEYNPNAGHGHGARPRRVPATTGLPPSRVSPGRTRRGGLGAAAPGTLGGPTDAWPVVRGRPGTQAAGALAGADVGAPPS